MTGSLRAPRSRGMLSGLALVLLGLWGGFVPFAGPYRHFAYSPDTTWAWTSGRLWLSVLPAAGTALGGLIVLTGANRLLAATGAALAAASGAWFAVGGTVSMLWTESGANAAGTPAGGTDRQVAETLAFYPGLGVIVVFFAAVALGRFSMHGAREAARAVPAPRREPAPVPAPETVPAPEPAYAGTGHGGTAGGAPYAPEPYGGHDATGRPYPAEPYGGTSGDRPHVAGPRGEGGTGTHAPERGVAAAASGPETGGPGRRGLPHRRSKHAAGRRETVPAPPAGPEAPVEPAAPAARERHGWAALLRRGDGTVAGGEPQSPAETTRPDAAAPPDKGAGGFWAGLPRRRSKRGENAPEPREEDGGSGGRRAEGEPLRRGAGPEPGDERVAGP